MEMGRGKTRPLAAGSLEFPLQPPIKRNTESVSVRDLSEIGMLRQLKTNSRNYVNLVVRLPRFKEEGL